ncbi:MAG: PCMD domain-containing protein [Paludibacteraceae bacterium]|nr:PCMD domain-containing protein [Paludibacteraceae bacterium]
MKKIFTTLFAGLMISVQVMAVSVLDVCGQYEGDLLLGSEDKYPESQVYLLPGVTDNTLTFVLPDFKFSGVSLGSIVLPNIAISENGQFTIEETTLYLADPLYLRATINILSSYEVEGVTYTSLATGNKAGIVLEIAEPQTLPEPIIVCFAGEAVRSNNYMLPNGGFEGAWTNNEPAGWHSFGTATGPLVGFVKGNTAQFSQSADVRPGSKGRNSAVLSSKTIFGVNANGNCTNGQIYAGSMTANDPAKNYNFSDPDSAFNTPFQGHPDSIVLWAKYIPGDRNTADDANQARLSAVITTNARYQDPELNNDSIKHADFRMGAATLNYSATADLGWQRLAVPFVYTELVETEDPAYILATFTTNKLPGGGNATQSAPDSVFIDDVELVYNNRISLLARGEETLEFNGEAYQINDTYCDSCGEFTSLKTGISTQAFYAFDAIHKCVFVYVIADDYAQTGKYNIYRVDFTDSDTEGTSIDPKEPDTQGIEDVYSGQTRFEKVLINGQLFIRSNDAWYNASGMRVK